MQTTAAAAPAAKVPVNYASLPRAERLKRALGLLRKIMADPNQTEHVLEFLGLINAGARRNRAAWFFSDAAGEDLFNRHRAIDSRTVDLDALLALPDGTLGHAYATFLRNNGLTPQVFDGPPPGITDPRTSYVVQRLRQTHDLWHVVTGCQTDPASEVALQAFTFAQLGAPGSALLAVFGTVRGVRQKPAIVADVVSLYRTGKRARKQAKVRLPTFAWEDHWATPLTEVRRMLGLPVAPPALRTAAAAQA